MSEAASAGQTGTPGLTPNHVRHLMRLGHARHNRRCDDGAGCQAPVGPVLPAKWQGQSAAGRATASHGSPECAGLAKCQAAQTSGSGGGSWAAAPAARVMLPCEDLPPADVSEAPFLGLRKPSISRVAGSESHLAVPCRPCPCSNVDRLQGGGGVECSSKCTELPQSSSCKH